MERMEGTETNVMKIFVSNLFLVIFKLRAVKAKGVGRRGTYLPNQNCRGREGTYTCFCPSLFKKEAAIFVL